LTEGIRLEWHRHPRHAAAETTAEGSEGTLPTPLAYGAMLYFGHA
jgi:hypothetical protein